MSRHDYERGLALEKADEPFFALIMAAMLRADSTNIVRLRSLFPATYAELDARYHAPGGVIKGDPDYDPHVHARR